jgi:EAL domain-containing protein (putative c-di-GMP-specific phosphodiesterase class I)
MTGELRGFECLLRLNHPTLGVLSPGQFMAGMQGTRIWSKLWPVMLKKIAKEQKLLGGKVRLAINVSPRELESSEVSDFISTFYYMAVNGMFEAATVEVEITEDFKILDYDAVNESINLLRSVGASVVVDDFGTGFCNLSALEKLNVNGVKVDKCFMEGAETSNVKRTIVKSLVEIAKVKECFILAEGIETEAERKIAIEVGCQFGQGYFLGRPAPSFAHKIQCNGFERPCAEIR